LRAAVTSAAATVARFQKFCTGVSVLRVLDTSACAPEQALGAEGPIVTPLVDEERRSAVHAAPNASHEVPSNPGGVNVFGQFPDEAGFVKTEG
jgi:hypothetical protein